MCYLRQPTGNVLVAIHAVVAMDGLQVIWRDEYRVARQGGSQLLLKFSKIGEARHEGFKIVRTSPVLSFRW